MSRPLLCTKSRYNISHQMVTKPTDNPNLLLPDVNDVKRKRRQIPKMIAENRECHLSIFSRAGAISAYENNVSRQEASSMFSPPRSRFLYSLSPPASRLSHQSPLPNTLPRALHPSPSHHQPAQLCSQMTASFHHMQHKANMSRLLTQQHMCLPHALRGLPLFLVFSSHSKI